MFYGGKLLGSRGNQDMAVELAATSALESFGNLIDLISTENVQQNNPCSVFRRIHLVIKVTVEVLGSSDFNSTVFTKKSNAAALRHALCFSSNIRIRLILSIYHYIRLF